MLENTAIPIGSTYRREALHIQKDRQCSPKFLLWTSSLEFSWWYLLSVTSAAFAISRPAHHRSERTLHMSVNVIENRTVCLATWPAGVGEMHAVANCAVNDSMQSCKGLPSMIAGSILQLSGRASESGSVFLLFEPSLGPDPERKGNTSRGVTGPSSITTALVPASDRADLCDELSQRCHQPWATVVKMSLKT